MHLLVDIFISRFCRPHFCGRQCLRPVFIVDHLQAWEFVALNRIVDSVVDNSVGIHLAHGIADFATHQHRHPADFRLDLRLDVRVVFEKRDERIDYAVFYRLFRSRVEPNDQLSRRVESRCRPRLAHFVDKFLMGASGHEI